MKREDKYPDTEYFTYFNANPKNRIGGDCVIRAVAVACNQSWEQTVREMTELGIKKGLVLNDSSLYPLYLKEKGFKEMPEPRDICNRKITVIEFIREEQLFDTMDDNNSIVANVGSHHVICIRYGVVYDIWNSSGSTMHKYWMK